MKIVCYVTEVVVEDGDAVAGGVTLDPPIETWRPAVAAAAVIPNSHDSNWPSAVVGCVGGEI